MRYERREDYDRTAFVQALATEIFATDPRVEWLGDHEYQIDVLDKVSLRDLRRLAAALGTKDVTVSSSPEGQYCYVRVVLS